jgi:hypothetical protein
MLVFRPARVANYESTQVPAIKLSGACTGVKIVHPASATLLATVVTAHQSKLQGYGRCSSASRRSTSYTLKATTASLAA